MLYNKTFYYQLYERTTKYCFYCTVLITTNHKSGNRQNLHNYHFLPTILSTQLPTQLPNIFCLPTVYTTTYTTTCGYRIRKHCLLFTIGHLTCIFKEGNTKTVKCAKQEKSIITCRKLILKEGEGERRTSYNLQTGRFFSCFFLFFIALCPITRFHFPDFTTFDL